METGFYTRKVQAWVANCCEVGTQGGLSGQEKVREPWWSPKLCMATDDAMLDLELLSP